MENTIDYTKLSEIIMEILDQDKPNLLYTNTDEFTCFYLDLHRPIQIKDWVKLFNGREYFWVEVTLSKNYIKENEFITGDRKKYIGRIGSLLQCDGPYNFGSNIEFLECQVFELLYFEELLSRFAKK